MTENKICPCCRSLPRMDKGGYCRPCNIKKQRERYHDGISSKQVAIVKRNILKVASTPNPAVKQILAIWPEEFDND